MLQSRQVLKEGRPAIWRQIEVEKELPQDNHADNLIIKKSRGKFPQLATRRRIPSIQNCIQIANVSGSPLPHSSAPLRDSVQKIYDIVNSDPKESLMRQANKMGIEIKRVSEIHSKPNQMQGPSQDQDIFKQANTNGMRNSNKRSLQIDHSMSITKNNIERKICQTSNLQRSHSHSRPHNQICVKHLKNLVSHLKRDCTEIKKELDQMRTQTVFVDEIKRKYEGEILSLSYKFQQRSNFEQNQKNRVIQELKQKLHTCKQEIKSLKLSKLQKDLDQETQKNQYTLSAQRQAESLQIINMELKKQLRCLRNSINSKDEELSQLGQAQKKLEKSLKATANESKKQKQIIEFQRQQNQSHTSHISQTLNKLIKDKGELIKKIEELQIQNQELKLKELEMSSEAKVELNSNKTAQLTTQVIRLKQALESQKQKNTCRLVQVQKYCKAKRFFQKEIQILKQNCCQVQQQLKEVKKQNLHLYEYIFEMEVKTIEAEKEIKEERKDLQKTENKTRGLVDQQKANSQKVKRLLLDIQTITEKYKHEERPPIQLRQRNHQYNQQYNQQQLNLAQHEQTIRDARENQIQKVREREQALIDKEFDISSAQERIQEMYQLRIQQLKQQQARIDQKIQDLNQMVEAIAKMHQTNVRKQNELISKQFNLNQRQERLQNKQYYVNKLFHELQRSRKCRQSFKMSRNIFNHSQVIMDAQLSLPESLQKDTRIVNPQSTYYHKQTFQTSRRSMCDSLPNADCNGQELLPNQIYRHESMKPTLHTQYTGFYSQRSQPISRSKNLNRDIVIDRKLERLKDNIRKEIESLIQ